MPRYILAEPGRLSRDSATFPLLGALGSTYAQEKCLFPRSVVLDGAALPLFLGGIASEKEIAVMINGFAEHIAFNYAGQHILLVAVLEGALPFVDALAAKLDTKKVRFERSALKVKSYSHGSRQQEIEVVSPLAAMDGQMLENVAGYDAIILLDDLIDTGTTAEWLAGSYLPGLGAKNIETCFLLDKQTARRPAKMPALAQTNRLNGKMVPDEWVVGFGLDLLFHSDRDELHLFRRPIPGGIYAFNNSIEAQLAHACQTDSEGIRKQLDVYVGLC